MRTWRAEDCLQVTSPTCSPTPPCLEASQSHWSSKKPPLYLQTFANLCSAFEAYCPCYTVLDKGNVLTVNLTDLGPPRRQACRIPVRDYLSCISWGGENHRKSVWHHSLGFRVKRHTSLSTFWLWTCDTFLPPWLPYHELNALELWVKISPLPFILNVVSILSQQLKDTEAGALCWQHWFTQGRVDTWWLSLKPSLAFQTLATQGTQGMTGATGARLRQACLLLHLPEWQVLRLQLLWWVKTADQCV